MLIGSESETRAESFLVAICDRVGQLITAVHGAEGHGALRQAVRWRLLPLIGLSYRLSASMFVRDGLLIPRVL